MRFGTKVIIRTLDSKTGKYNEIKATCIRARGIYLQCRLEEDDKSNGEYNSVKGYIGWWKQNEVRIDNE